MAQMYTLKFAFLILFAFLQDVGIAFESDDSCQDRNKNCFLWARAEKCKIRQFRSYMEKFCPLSCGSCHYSKSYTDYKTSRRHDDPCIDRTHNCMAWKQKGYCSYEYVTYMELNCRLTCGLCAIQQSSVMSVDDECNDISTHCRVWSERGFCTKGVHNNYVKRQCKKSCNVGSCQRKWTTPSPTTPPVISSTRKPPILSTTPTKSNDVCADLSARCKAWSSRGQCDKSYKVKKICCHSCRQKPLPSTDETLAVCGRIMGMKIENSFKKIIGGAEADEGTIPWQVYLPHQNNKSFCGGTLANKHFIITAAHCFYQQYRTKSIGGIYAHLGFHNVSHPTANSKKIRVVQIILHPKFDPRNGENDIALLQLSDPVEYSAKVRPICLPSSKISFYNGRPAVVSGWGAVSRTKSQNDVLMQVKTQILSPRKCNKILSRVTQRENEVTTKMICAGFAQGGIDSCEGDSGGPLTTNWNGRQYLAGIISWGYGCGNENLPGVYTNVKRFVGWITKHIG